MKLLLSAKWKISICLIVLFLIPGCWSRTELSDLSFVSGACIDTLKDEPGIRLIVEVARVDILASTVKTDTTAFFTFEQTGKTVFDAIRNVTLESPHKLFWGHQQMQLITERIAEEGFVDAISFFVRDHETSRNVMMAIAEGDVAEFMQASTSKEGLPMNGLRTMLKDSSSNGKVIPVEIHDYLRAHTSPGICFMLPIIGVKREGTQTHYIVTGTGLFSDDKMVGRLTPDQTRGIAWLLNKVDSAVLPLNVTDTAKEKQDELMVYEVSLEVIKAKSAIKALGSLKFEVETTLSVSLGEDNFQETFSESESPALNRKIEQAIVKLVEQEMQTAIRITKELKTDPAGFGRALYRQRPEERKQVGESWCEEHYPEIEVAYKTKVDIIGNMMIKDIDSH